MAGTELLDSGPFPAERRPLGATLTGAILPNHVHHTSHLVAAAEVRLLAAFLAEIRSFRTTFKDT